MKTNNYLKQAQDFLKNHGSEMSIKYLRTGKHFNDDKEDRDIYEITLKRGSREFVFNFGNSIYNSTYKIGTREFTRNELKTCLDKEGKIIVRFFASKFFQITNSDKIVYPKPPNEYDILACLTKYDPGTFEDFCNEFGYGTDSKKAEKTYNAVKDEYLKLCSLYSGKEMDILSEIQ